MQLLDGEPVVRPDEAVDFVTEDIDTESLLGHLYLTSNLHSIPIDYPPSFFKAAKLMEKCTWWG